MSHPRIQMFLRERDRARIRGDLGVDRSLTADLLRLGVPEDATLAHPSGQPSKVARKTEAAVLAEDEEPQRRGGRPKLPRCEHDQIADRCPICNEELLVS